MLSDMSLKTESSEWVLYAPVDLGCLSIFPVLSLSESRHGENLKPFIRTVRQERSKITAANIKI